MNSHLDENTTPDVEQRNVKEVNPVEDSGEEARGVEEADGTGERRRSKKRRHRRRVRREKQESEDNEHSEEETEEAMESKKRVLQAESKPAKRIKKDVRRKHKPESKDTVDDIMDQLEREESPLKKPSYLEQSDDSELFMADSEPDAPEHHDNDNDSSDGGGESSKVSPKDRKKGRTKKSSRGTEADSLGSDEEAMQQGRDVPVQEEADDDQSHIFWNAMTIKALTGKDVEVEGEDAANCDDLENEVEDIMEETHKANHRSHLEKQKESMQTLNNEMANMHVEALKRRAAEQRKLCPIMLKHMNRQMPSWSKQEDLRLKHIPTVKPPVDPTGTNPYKRLADDMKSHAQGYEMAVQWASSRSLITEAAIRGAWNYEVEAVKAMITTFFEPEYNIIEQHCKVSESEVSMLKEFAHKRGYFDIHRRTSQIFSKMEAAKRKQPIRIQSVLDPSTPSLLPGTALEDLYLPQPPAMEGEEESEWGARPWYREKTVVTAPAESYLLIAQSQDIIDPVINNHHPTFSHWTSEELEMRRREKKEQKKIRREHKKMMRKEGLFDEEASESDDNDDPDRDYIIGVAEIPEDVPDTRRKEIERKRKAYLKKKAKRQKEEGESDDSDDSDYLYDETFVDNNQEENALNANVIEAHRKQMEADAERRYREQFTLEGQIEKRMNREGVDEFGHKRKFKRENNEDTDESVSYSYEYESEEEGLSHRQHKKLEREMKRARKQRARAYVEALKGINSKQSNKESTTTGTAPAIDSLIPDHLVRVLTFGQAAVVSAVAASAATDEVEERTDQSLLQEEEEAGAGDSESDVEMGMLR